MQDDQSRCREAGMDGYLVKPLRLDTLAEALAKISRTPAMTGGPQGPPAPMSDDRRTTRVRPTPVRT
jgi:hypothetical protein